jgi:hypothetical protein
MNEEIRTQGQVLSGIICIVSGGFLLLLSLAFLFSYPDEIWQLGLLLLGSGGVLVYSGIASIRKSKKIQS